MNRTLENLEPNQPAALKNPKSLKNPNRLSSRNSPKNPKKANSLQVIPSRDRTVTRCQLCGFAEVRTDEVVDREVLYLAECPRCENRWTSRAPIGHVQAHTPTHTQPRLVRPAARSFERVPARVGPTVAPAA